MNFWIRIFGFYLSIGKLYQKKRTSITWFNRNGVFNFKPAIRGYYISIMVTYK